MHYGASEITSGVLATIDVFLADVPADWTIEQPDSTSFSLRADELVDGKPRVVVLKHLETA